MYVHNGPRTGNENDSRSGFPEQQTCKRCNSAACINDLAARIATRSRKSILAHVADKIGTHLEVVLINHPGEGVAECCKVLASLAFGITVTIATEVHQPPSEIDEGVPVGGELRLTYNRRISIDCVLIESYAGQKAFQSGVAVSKAIFAIKPATGFVDQIAAEHMYVRAR